MAYGDQFWGNIGTGLLQTGAGFYADEEARKRGEQRYQQAQGPLYDKMIAQAGKSLDLAGNMDPKAHAAERYDAWTNLQKPSWEEEDLALDRKLQARGQGGIRTNAPVAGLRAPEGGMNPQYAALYAAREKGKEQAAYDSLNQGEAYLNNLLNRGTTLQDSATVNTGRVQEQRKNIPSKTSWGEQIASGISKNPQMVAGLIKELPGMIDGVGKLFKGGGNEYPTITPGMDDGSDLFGDADMFSDMFRDDYLDFDMGFDVDWNIDNVDWDDWDFGGSDAGGYWW